MNTNSRQLLRIPLNLRVLLQNWLKEHKEQLCVHLYVLFYIPLCLVSLSLLCSSDWAFGHCPQRAAACLIMAKPSTQTPDLAAGQVRSGH